MTQSVEDVRLARKFARQKDELSRRVKEETLDVYEVSEALQLLIENRFFVPTVDVDELSKIELDRLELREETEISVIVDKEPVPEEVAESFNLTLRLEHNEHRAELPLDGLIDGLSIPAFLVFLGTAIREPLLVLRHALNKMGRLSIELEKDYGGEDHKVLFSLCLPNREGFSARCRLSEVAYFLEIEEGGAA